MNNLVDAIVGIGWTTGMKVGIVPNKFQLCLRHFCFNAVVCQRVEMFSPRDGIGLVANYLNVFFLPCDLLDIMIDVIGKF